MPKALRVAVLGPKGQCGQCVVDELLSRGHSVVGISRSPPKTWPQTGNYDSVAVNFGDIESFSSILSEGGFEAVVCAFAPPLHDLRDVYRVGVEGHGNIKMAIMKSSYRGPLIIIGQYYSAIHIAVSDLLTSDVSQEVRVPCILRTGFSSVTTPSLHLIIGEFESFYMPF